MGHLNSFTRTLDDFTCQGEPCTNQLALKICPIYPQNVYLMIN